MNPYISEFSFGYAATSELMAMFNLKSAGAPEFATQYAEGKPGGGWDVKLPVLPVFIQFKRAHRMVRRTASEAQRFPSLPFFRMHLHRRDHSDQQQLLLDLEGQGNDVWYVAPGFSYANELHDAFSSDDVLNRSIFVRPSWIGPLVDDDDHWVAFQVDPHRAVICSEPRSLEVASAKQFAGSFRTAAHGRSPIPADDFFIGLSDQLLSIYEKRRPSDGDRVLRIGEVRQRRSPAEYARVIAQTLFDCELLVVPQDAVT